MSTSLESKQLIKISAESGLHRNTYTGCGRKMCPGFVEIFLSSALQTKPSGNGVYFSPLLAKMSIQIESHFCCFSTCLSAIASSIRQHIILPIDLRVQCVLHLHDKNAKADRLRWSVRKSVKLLTVSTRRMPRLTLQQRIRVVQLYYLNLRSIPDTQDLFEAQFARRLQTKSIR